MTMPKPTPEEMAEITRRFENFDYETAVVYEAGDPNTPAHILITQALAAKMYHQRQADKAMHEAVDAARTQGLSWHRIGLQLGVTGEAARQRYAHT